ncbi:MAG: UPF0365 family protein, partial [Bacteroidetes bacterium]|nr:UPF0365 family protein [Bacteroidota bacterium]
MEAVFPFFFLFLIIIGLSIFLYFVPLGLWVTAFFSGVKVSIFKDLVGMRLRKVAPGPIIKALITASKAGLMISLNQLETHYLAGGNVQRVIQALISADKARLGLTFENATAIDLAGRDVFEAVQISVNPKVIETPPITALAKDGIQVRA